MNWLWILLHPIAAVRAMISLWRDPPGLTFILPLPPEDDGE